MGTMGAMALMLGLTAQSSSAVDGSSASASGRSPATCPQPAYVVPTSTVDLEPEEAGRKIPPPNTAGPTLVGIGFRIDDIRQIDPVQDDFVFLGYVRTTWCDPRLAFDADEVGTSERVFTNDQVMREFSRIWFPAAYPVNQVGALDIRERILRIKSDGTVEQDINLSVHLSAHYDFQHFPFDRQTLEIQIESLVWSRSKLRVVNDEARTGFSENMRIPEWTIESVGGRVEDVSVMRSPALFSRFVLDVRIARRSGFYVWKVFLPLLIIVSLSWSVFWMPNENLASRTRISATGILTIVAYQFVFSGDLPRVGYLTSLDKIMIVSFGLLAVTVLESMLVDRYQSIDPERAHRIDVMARWVFPSVYAIALSGIVAGG
jgi:hypothetical protein